MECKFTITDNAASRVLQLLKDQPLGSCFRISVNGGGCSGFQYEFDYKAYKSEGDLEFSHNGAAIIIDEISLNFINGSSLDYSEDLGGARFEIKNPNATAKCGCGNSFAL